MTRYLEANVSTQCSSMRSSCAVRTVRQPQGAGGARGQLSHAHGTSSEQAVSSQRTLHIQQSFQHATTATARSPTHVFAANAANDALTYLPRQLESTERRVQKFGCVKHQARDSGGRTGETIVAASAKRWLVKRLLQQAPSAGW